METHARYFLIGLFSLVVTLALILFVLWLGKMQRGLWQYFGADSARKDGTAT